MHANRIIMIIDLEQPVTINGKEYNHIGGTWHRQTPIKHNGQEPVLFVGYLNVHVDTFTHQVVHEWHDLTEYRGIPLYDVENKINRHYRYTIKLSEVSL